MIINLTDEENTMIRRSLGAMGKNTQAKLKNAERNNRTNIAKKKRAYLYIISKMRGFFDSIKKA